MDNNENKNNELNAVKPITTVEIKSPTSSPFGKKKSNRSEGSDNSALVSEMQAIKSILQSILSKEGGVFIDGNKVGSTLALASYKTQ